MARFVFTTWFWWRVVLAIVTLSLAVVELVGGPSPLVVGAQVMCIAGNIATSIADAFAQRRR